MKRRFIIVAAMSLGNTLALRAQDPVRLPGVRVTAQVDKPGTNRVAGVVRDTGAIAIDGVEITIPGLQKRAISDSTGKFHFDGVRAGKHDIRARKIGYAPQIREVEVDDKGGIVTFEMLPRMTTLLPVISNAARGGLSISVGDTGYRAIARAKVHLLGKPERGETDSLGQFFFPVGPGRYFLSIRQDGFDDKIVSVSIPADSGRHVTVLMPAQTKEKSHRYAWKLENLDKRLALRSNNGSWVYTHDELARDGFDWASDAVDRGLGLAGARTGLAAGCYATVDGGPDAVEISKLTIDDVETMEIYRDARQAERVTQRPTALNNLGGTRGVADSRSATRLPLSGAYDAAYFNANIRPPCPIVFIWTR